MIPPIEDYNKLLEIHQSFSRNVDNLSDFAIKLQDDSYEVGRKRGWIESKAMRDELLAAVQGFMKNSNRLDWPADIYDAAEAVILKHTEKQA